MTQRNTADTLAWLAADRKAGRLIWEGKCLARARTARNLIAVAPSALAAQHMVPMSDRIYDLSKIGSVQGLVGFADNPNDSNPFGHVYTFIGRNSVHLPLVDTNDALVEGGGSVVGYDWFRTHWNVPFVFASTSLNGFALDLPGGNHNGNNHPTHHENDDDPATFRLKNLDYGIHRLEKAVIYWQKPHGGKKHPGLVAALKKDLAELKQTRHEFPKGGK